jgi:hypothetical protein
MDELSCPRWLWRGLRDRSKIERLLLNLSTKYGTQVSEGIMKKWVFVLMTVFIALGATVQSQETAPLKLVQTITLPPDVKGHFDHLGISKYSTARNDERRDAGLRGALRTRERKKGWDQTDGVGAWFDRGASKVR